MLVARVRVEAVVALSLPLSWPVATRVDFCCAAAVVILVLVDFDFVVAVAAGCGCCGCWPLLIQRL